MPQGSFDLRPGVLLLCISGALLWWSLPRLKEAFLEQDDFAPTTHISTGSDCEYGQKARMEFDIDGRGPTTFTLAFLGIAPPSPSHPCEYIYVRFPGHIDNAYADELLNPMASVEFKENIYELASLGFAQNFGSGGEAEGLHFVRVLSLGEEFREDVALGGIHEKFWPAVA